MTKSKLLATSALGMAALLTGTAQAQSVGTDLLDAVTGGKVHMELRPRYEHVKDDAVSKDANAFTMRSVLGYRTGLFHGFSAYGEFDNVSQFGGSAFNDTINGKTNRAVVADPKDTRVSQIYLQYLVPPGAYGTGANLQGLGAAFGRQNIKLVDVRWIGDVGWRQTRQMFDGATVTYDFKPIGLSFEYNYFYNVDRIFGQKSANSDISLNAHLVTLDLGLNKLIHIPAHLIGYAYLFDFDSGQPVPMSGQLSGQDSSKDSNKVFGVRLHGTYPLTPDKRFQLLYTGEFANQSDYANGSSVIDADYILGQLGVDVSGITLSGNYELLGSNGGKYALQTTFATGHAWNGWADRFLTTPADGLVDIWGQVGATSPAMWGPALGGIKLDTRYHTFNSDHGSTHYGDEFDIAVSKKVTPELAFLVKFAQYWGDSEASGSLAKDTQKYWLQGDFKF